MLEILHVEDDDIFAMFVSSICLPNEKITHVYTGEQAVDLFKRKRFDLLLQDIGLAGMNGVKAAELIYKKYPISIAFVTNHHEIMNSEEIEEINKHPNVGFCCKIDKRNGEHCKRSLEEFVNEFYLRKKLKQQFLGDRNNKSLSPAEKDIYLDCKEKLTAKQIARKRNISPGTVHAHKSSILQKIKNSFRKKLI